MTSRVNLPSRLARLEARSDDKADVFSVFFEVPQNPERTREAYDRLTLSRSGYPIFFSEEDAQL